MPNALQHLALLLEDLGPATPGVACVTRNGDGVWLVRFDDGGAVHLAVRDDAPRLELAAEVGLLAQHDAEFALRAAMMFNFLSADTGGARMALAADDTVYLMRDVPLEAITLADLQAHIAELDNIAHEWDLVFTQVASTTAGETA
ncbi:type III secretion system chaperone [Ramlibacter albus]|uniref:Type III secretion system chaperone n=1 Tax=Ramlibacter albus TaxID=2079448 RepID=A0A923M8V3_9BURK|nr:type III secretion system chaperone [Ramlibacter albus]MBC5765505.1 type III secretion system chaperone [Ramlibacter albus]